MQLVVRGYETQVRIFMVLVVLFLVSANLVTVTFLSRSEALLVEEAGARALAATVSAAREAASAGLPAMSSGGPPGSGALVSERLTRLAAAHGASVIDITDGAGKVLASSQSWRVGAVEAVDAGLDPASSTALRAGRPVLLPAADEEDLTVALAPLGMPGAGPPAAILRAGYLLDAAGAIRRQIRFLTWAQGIGGTVVLVMVLLFTRYVLRPYRALRAAAEGLQPAAASGAADDPAFLVSSFRGVVEKMRSLEGELERMKFGASSAGAQEALLTSLSSGVLILDADGAVTALNPAGERILGRSAGEVVGRKAVTLFEGSPDFAAILGDAVRFGRGRSREVVPHRLPGGRTVHLGVTVSGPPRGGAGALCLFSDLTEIRGVQARVLLKENLARVGELSAGIAHEFRNSLAAILGYARLVAREGPAPAENAEAIIREVQSTGRLVDEFLRYAGPARLQRGPVGLRGLLAEVAREAAREGESVDIALEGDFPETILADEGLLKQAFVNLVRNAVEASRGGAAPGRVRIHGRVEPGSAVVEISDSGPGFSPEILERLFTPFVTTKERGTGLGMALAQKVVVSHDGSVEAGNDGGGGARVTISLPLE